MVLTVFRLHLLGALLYCRTTVFKCLGDHTKCFGCPKFKEFYGTKSAFKHIPLINFAKVHDPHTICLKCLP